MCIGFENSSWMGSWILLFPPALQSQPTRHLSAPLDIAQRPPVRWSIFENTPSRPGRGSLGFEAFFTRVTGPRAKLASLGLQPDEGDIHETCYPRILTINGGSSSIKFALYEIEEPLNEAVWKG